MITASEITANEKMATVKCDSCGAEQVKNIKKEELEFSNTEASLCDKCSKDFLKWMGTTGKRKNACWCKCVPEYLSTLKE